MPVNTRVVSLKVFVAEHEKWKHAAATTTARSFNDWARSRLNEAAELDFKLADDLAARRDERQRLVERLRGGDAA